MKNSSLARRDLTVPAHKSRHIQAPPALALVDLTVEELPSDSQNDRDEITSALASKGRYEGLGDVIIEGRGKPERIRFSEDVRFSWAIHEGAVVDYDVRVPRCAELALEYIEDVFGREVLTEEPHFDATKDEWTIELELRPLEKARVA